MSGLTEFRGLPAIRLTAADGATALVCLHGAQVVSWIPAGGSEQLFVSETARCGPGEAVRGGIPVVFPQFSSLGSLPRHGFARNREWRLMALHHREGLATIVLQLTDDQRTRELWPHPFVARLTVMIGGNQLDVELMVENPGYDRFAFTAALHTYLRVADIEACGLDGLKGATFVDALTGARGQENEEIRFIDGPVDRLYLGVGHPVLLAEPGRRLSVDAEGWPDLVLWNPWREKGALLADLEPEGYRRMVCVEAAIVERPVELESDQMWSGRQTLVAL